MRLFPLFITLLFCLPSFATVEKDTEALSKLHHGNLYEVEISSLVETHGGCGCVKKFAKMLFEDHKALDKKLFTLATSLDISVAEFEKSAEELALLKELEALKGKKFDLLFLEKNIDRHQATLDYLTEVKPLLGTEIGSFVDKIKPMIQHHHDEAKELFEHHHPN